MREFIFRAWDNKNQKMIYPPSCIDSFLGPTVTFDGRTYIEGRYQDLIYMPWTGLIDKNAEYIYEGDLLGGSFEGGYIKFCEECKNLQYHVAGDCFACSGDIHWYELVEEDGDLIVLGNIFEDPRLMI